MKHIIRLTLAAALGLAMTVGASAEDGATWIRDTLKATAASVDPGTSEAAAIKGTLARISSIELPPTGKVILVNIASGVVTAYQDGETVIESKAVVGKDTTQTPELNTHVTFVRPNPTWTVPKSIIKLNGWMNKVSTNPKFFDDNHFDLMSHGKVLSPREAARDPDAVDAFVQRPGKGNALGRMKIGIENNQAIYLHDTNDPGKFDAEVRAASHGCVRVEQVQEIAAWVMGIDPAEMASIVDGNSTENMTPPEPVKVILGYWTAWPDKSGVVRFYPDIYGKDGGGTQTSARHRREAPENIQDGEQTAVEEAPAPRPQFIPAPNDETDEEQRPGIPAWTEYQTR